MAPRIETPAFRSYRVAVYLQGAVAVLLIAQCLAGCFHDFDTAADAGSGLTAAPDSSASLDREDLEGFWDGVTDAGHFRFEVRGGTLAMLWFEWTVAGCGSLGATESFFSPTVRLFDQQPLEAGDAELLYRVSGSFDSTAAGSGDLRVMYSRGGCSEDVDFKWNANRAVCGNGTVDWPESCEPDEGAQGPCGETCQPEILRESEPNGDPVTANGPLSPGTVVFGSVTSAGDVDTYELHNGSEQSVKIRLETSGPSIGTCGIDTTLEILRGDPGSPMTTRLDDHSGLGECSSVQYTLPGGTSVYVQVRAGGDSTRIAGYHLSIVRQ